MVALLRARYRAYRNAKIVQGLFVLLTIALPIFSIPLAEACPSVKEYLALTALLLLLLDVGIFDRLQKDWMKKGAKLQEEFDVRVLGMQWKGLVAGAKVDHEDVHAASARPLRKKRESQLTPWYEPCVGEVPLPFGRLICQRTNISYDARLRKRYGNFLLLGSIALCVVLLYAALAFHLNFSALVLTVGVPLTPVLGWALREQRRQADAAITLANLKSEFEKLWERALVGAKAKELEQGSRELQDALYRHRAASPLVFDWVYDCLRSANEDEAHHAAQRLVAQAKAAIDKE
ncbi:MAG: hypothetical protein KIT42_05220 [Rhodocyclaceae bacterium]|nr:hypothetical protein [Rhodocyclaceae bacterium]